MPISALSALIKKHYQWALDLDLNAQASRQQFWYVSEEKLEPRLGNAFEEEGQSRGCHLRWHYIADLKAACADMPDDMMVAELLMKHPPLRLY